MRIEYTGGGAKAYDAVIRRKMEEANSAQGLEEKDTISVKFSPERSPEKNEGAAEQVAAVENSLKEDLKPVQDHLSVTTKDKDSFLLKTVVRETSSREESDVDISPTEDQIVQRDEEVNYTDRVELLSAGFATSTIGFVVEEEDYALSFVPDGLKGFGSKMMAKLGYVMGSGLGKNGEGRTEPVECILLPRGKSLDHCMEIKQKALRKAKKRRLRQQNIIAEGQENKCVEVQAADENHSQVSLDVSNTRTSSGIQDNQMMKAPSRSLESERYKLGAATDESCRKISRLEESVLNQKAFDLPLNMSIAAKSRIVATELALSKSNTRAIKLNQTNIKDLEIAIVRQLKRLICETPKVTTVTNFIRWLFLNNFKKIDTEKKLDVLVRVLYAKAVEEQIYTPKYAEVCKLMFEIEIPSVSGTGIVRFQKVLLDRCQQAFEKQKKFEEEIISRNISFFGELFKLKIVTVEIVNFCLSELLKSPTEEQIEYLCKFISIIGKTYEEEYDASYQRAVADAGNSEKQIHIQLTKLDVYLDEIKKLSWREDFSSRIRLMLMQVLDLKKNQWVPLREGDVFTEVGSANAKKWKVELATLKSNNARLTAALQESTANVEEWKRQLEAFKEENVALKSKLLDTETNKGDDINSDELSKEIRTLRLKCDSLETELKTKDEKVKDLSTELEILENFQCLYEESQKHEKATHLVLSRIDEALKSTRSVSILIENLRVVFLDNIKEIEDAARNARRNAADAIKILDGHISIEP
ncbi:hypothetical protein QYM36_011398 [Artemia franciscana]|uniref:G-patch domain-containing protein n=1 Tax=Artemia franciscana TaxID=6661 RepID=A0AA88HXC2_ARTSF|nr:hypothetical protein QYM36_011398 [Artemia franciscana]